MEIELTTVIAAILQVCVSGRRSFTPSSVRKMIQHLNGAAARMDAATISSKTQPHFRTLTQCGCIEFVPTTQLRNKPRRITDRDRLQILNDDPTRVHEFYTDAIEVELEVADLIEDELAPEGTDKPSREEGILDLRRELLEALEEHENGMLEMMVDGNQKLFDTLHGIEQQLSSLRELLVQTHRQFNEADLRDNGETVRISLAPEPQMLAPARAAPVAACDTNVGRPAAEVLIAEDMPQWLSLWKRNHRISMTDFFASRVLFYPGSGTDGQPVEFFGSRHVAHCFVYVDDGITRVHVLEELGEKGHPFVGYKSAGRTNLVERDLTPNGWVPHIEPAAASQGRSVPGRPYAFVEILKRQPGFGDEHGPVRLAILILCADGVAAYDSLFCQATATAPFAVVINDHGFGDNWTRFGRGGDLEHLASITGRLPQFLLVDVNIRAWAGYLAIDRVNRFGRQLWRRFDDAGDTVIAPKPLHTEVSEVSSVAVVDDQPSRPPVQGEPERLADAAPRPSAHDLFFQGIAGVPTAENLISRLIALSNEMHCEDRHTYTHVRTRADIRIRCDRAAPSPISQNILTMDWQPKLSRFSCRTYLPTEECIHLGLAETNVRPNGSGPLPTVITPELDVDDDVFLSIVLASIHMFRGD